MLISTYFDMHKKQRPTLIHSSDYYFNNIIWTFFMISKYAPIIYRS